MEKEPLERLLSIWTELTVRLLACIEILENAIYHRCPACGATLETVREDGQTWQFCLNCGLTAP